MEGNGARRGKLKRFDFVKNLILLCGMEKKVFRLEAEDPKVGVLEGVITEDEVRYWTEWCGKKGRKVKIECEEWNDED